jgi:hypothetical protein
MKKLNQFIIKYAEKFIWRRLLKACGYSNQVKVSLQKGDGAMLVTYITLFKAMGLRADITISCNGLIVEQIELTED